MTPILTGNKLKAIRALRGMTQAELATAANLSVTAIREYERGRRDLRADSLRKLCEALNVQVTYSVDGMVISGP